MNDLENQIKVEQIKDKNQYWRCKTQSCKAKLCTYIDKINKIEVLKIHDHVLSEDKILNVFLNTKLKELAKKAHIRQIRYICLQLAQQNNLNCQLLTKGKFIRMFKTIKKEDQ